MPDKTRIAQVTEIPPGSFRVCDVDGRKITVFNVDGEFHAVDDRCPHRGASLGAGSVDGSVVTCPLHEWQFDVTTGHRVGRPGSAALTRYPVSREGDALFVEAASAEETAEQDGWDGVYRYLVRYGTMGWVACFGSVEKVECDYRDRVVVQTDRGIELGEVLATPDENHGDAAAADNRQPTGEVLRSLTPEDEEQARRLRDRPVPVFDECRRLLAERGLSVEVIDGEVLFDEQTVVLYYIGEPSTDLGRLTEELSRDRTEKVIFHPVFESAVEPAGGGEGGCGTGGCGQCGS